MGFEIRFRANPRFQDENWIIYRIAKIVCHRPAIEVQDQGYKWTLDNSKDWKMDRDSKTGEYILSYRYGRQREMEALRTSIIWLLGLADFNP